MIEAHRKVFIQGLEIPSSRNIDLSLVNTIPKEPVFVDLRENERENEEEFETENVEPEFSPREEINKQHSEANVHITSRGRGRPKILEEQKIHQLYIRSCRKFH